MSVVQELTDISFTMKENILGMTQQIETVASSTTSVAKVVAEQVGNTEQISASADALRMSQDQDSAIVAKLTAKVQLIDVSIDVLEQSIAKFK